MASPKKSTWSRRIPAGSLNPAAFAPFGDVIQNPHTHNGHPRGLASVAANQNTATKVVDVTHMLNHYHLAPSRRPARTAMNMFVCRPRELVRVGDHHDHRAFPIRILERHPFTPQTFIPMGLNANDQHTKYLVIVAPTLPSPDDVADDPTLPLASPPPPPNSNVRKPKGPGMPDLDRIQAFIARGDQAVTYGPGTWHAPMVVLGERPIEFVVVQFANGVAGEDVQEVNVDVHDGGAGVMVQIDNDTGVTVPGLWKPKL